VEPRLPFPKHKTFLHISQNCGGTTTPFNGHFSRTTWVSRYQKGKISLDLNVARDYGALGCSGISWTICKQCAPRSRQITTPTPHHSEEMYIIKLLYNYQLVSFHNLMSPKENPAIMIYFNNSYS